jgi:hypothetical protein
VYARLPLDDDCERLEPLAFSASVKWYKNSFGGLPSESPSQDELTDTVIRMRQKGLKATGCNSATHAINAYLPWSSAGDRKCGAGCQHCRSRCICLTCGWLDFGIGC